ncbi:hypothetical protein SP60_04270 [Candidatus Thioglobus autotrophicus]|uniref:Uncharacterized protein n=1 Tax=Candidatus Thioglobus autotrophicus TaxID=1705394 RepID=A0A0M4PKL8_9GAMM|nr:hypothetical protein [Candidatus Thioglobus autotrophicus]ALE52499.1 hypothetical protein SP60_04270 [Candidatus Thioglobus autotrophicus]WPE16524.1 hypothetical protein R5P06_00270 [Candidatus Thioglobus autotrophicus]
MLKKSTRLFPAQKIATIVLLFFTLIGGASATNHTTEVIKADVIGIEPIYMNYTLKKVATPCDSGKPRCWNVSYQKEVAKVLKGYRVKLSYKNNTFTARMLNEPTQDYLKIRVKSDLLVMPSTVAINAAVVY